MRLTRFGAGLEQRHRVVWADGVAEGRKKGRALLFAIVEQAASIFRVRWRNIDLAESHTSAPLI